MGFCLGSFIRSLQDRLGELQIPVADLTPCEGIQRIGCVVEPVVGQGSVHCFADLCGFTDNPFVQRLRDNWHRRVAGVWNFVVLSKTEGVPQFGAEIAVPFDPVLRQFQHAANRCHLRHRKAQRVGPEFVHDHKRVDSVAFGL